MSGSAYATIGGSGGMMSTAGLELPYPRISQAKSGTKLLEGESNVTFVKRLYANKFTRSLCLANMVGI